MYDNIELDYDLSDFPNFVDANIISADYNGLKVYFNRNRIKQFE